MNYGGQIARHVITKLLVEIAGDRGLAMRPDEQTSLRAIVLPHQSGLLVLKEMAMIHERVFARCWPIESDEKLHFILNKTPPSQG